jgi:RNA polymerase sigma-70 factor, ECF subfamily
LELTHAEDEPQSTGETDPARLLDIRAASGRLFLGLAPKERATVVLSDVMDFQLGEIASMLKMTVGAVKSALHRGRKKLQLGKASTPLAATAPREVVDKFVTALTARDFEAIKALCLKDVTVDMVGGSSFEGFDDAKMTFEYAHFVKLEWGFGENPNWRVAEYLGEPIVIGFRTLNGIEGLNDIWRLEMGDGGIGRLRLYCFSPDVIAMLAAELGVPALPRPYRSPG